MIYFSVLRGNHGSLLKLQRDFGTMHAVSKMYREGWIGDGGRGERRGNKKRNKREAWEGQRERMAHGWRGAWRKKCHAPVQFLLCEFNIQTEEDCYSLKYHDIVTKVEHTTHTHATHTIHHTTCISQTHIPLPHSLMLGCTGRKRFAVSVQQLTYANFGVCFSTVPFLPLLSLCYPSPPMFSSPSSLPLPLT